MVMLPEYMVQQMADIGLGRSRSGRAWRPASFDTSPFLDRALLQPTQTEGVQWSMPFNVSAPVLFYNKTAFAAAPGSTRRCRRSASRSCGRRRRRSSTSGAAAYGIALDSGVDSGGGWFIEQWFARAGEPYADNDNGRVGAGDAGALRRAARRRPADARCSR